MDMGVVKMEGRSGVGKSNGRSEIREYFLDEHIVPHLSSDRDYGCLAQLII